MSSPAPTGHGLSINITYTLAVFMEALVHGIYTMLFITAVPLIFKGFTMKLARSAPSTMIFPLSAVAMYTISSVHVVLALHSFIKAYITVADSTLGWQTFWATSEWDAFLGSILFCLMAWVSDGVVIYRCYCIWNKNIHLIIFPLLLLLGSLAVNIYNLTWFRHPLSSLSPSQARSFNVVFPLNLVQNVLTTGLIAFKIWRQHRRSSAMRVVDRSSRLSLVKIIRIIIESAMTYTIQLLIIIILYFRDNNIGRIIWFAIVPSSGIVFVLIALRVHHSKQQLSAVESSLGVIPVSWMRDIESGASQQDNASLNAAGLPAKSEDLS